MTSDEPGSITAEQLASALGSGFLHNAIREKWVTCEICATPCESYIRCKRCNDDRSEASSGAHQQAHLVVPLAYGVKGLQSGRMMHDYKWRHGAVARSRKQLAFRLWAALTLHRRCIEKTVGAPITAWTTVPSTSDRTGPHPLVAVATAAGPPGDQITLLRGPKFSPEDRAFEPERWALTDPGAVAGRHILVIDDTWTSGGRAQSAAMVATANGANAVTILVLARWLDPAYGQTTEFVKDRLPNEPDYNPDVCPVTGTDCPASQPPSTLG